MKFQLPSPSARFNPYGIHHLQPDSRRARNTDWVFPGSCTGYGLYKAQGSILGLGTAPSTCPGSSLQGGALSSQARCRVTQALWFPSGLDWCLSTAPQGWRPDQNHCISGTSSRGGSDKWCRGQVGQGSWIRFFFWFWLIPFLRQGGTTRFRWITARPSTNSTEETTLFKSSSRDAELPNWFTSHQLGSKCFERKEL